MSQRDYFSFCYFHDNVVAFLPANFFRFSFIFPDYVLDYGNFILKSGNFFQLIFYILLIKLRTKLPFFLCIVYTLPNFLSFIYNIFT